MYHMEHKMVQNPPWLNSTFKELSNEYSHAQIRVKMKKLWPRQIGKEKQAIVRKYVATGIVSRPVSRQAACQDQCRDKQYVATRKLCRDKKVLSRPETLRNLKTCRKLIFFYLISSPFHPRTIYILVF